MPARRLKTICKYINENVEGLSARTEKGFCDTDRKIGRLRWPGKGRAGTRLIVTAKNGDVVCDHNAAETYRCNQEVEDWLAQWERGARQRKGAASWWRTYTKDSERNDD